MRYLALVLVLTILGFAQGPKEYATVITPGAKTQAGIFNVHQISGKIYYEIPRAELGKPYLWLTRVSRAANALGYGNGTVSRWIIDWKLHNDRVLLEAVLDYGPVADPALPIARAVATISNPPIIMAFPVQTQAPDSAIVIDVTNLFASDVPEFSMRTTLKAQGFDPSRSYVESVTASPASIDVEAAYTYTGITGAEPVGVADAQRIENGLTLSSASFVLHHSMLKLPEQPMKPPLADPRVGLMTREQLDFGLPTNRAPIRTLINRWRLEKKDPEAPVSDPVKPIEIYVDPATPAKWVPYVKQAIEDWRPALEQAGFRNAIVAREVSRTDKDWSPEDARYTVVSWQALTAPYAFTGVVTDPRSGEILLAQIHFFQGIIDRMAGKLFCAGRAARPARAKVAPAR